MNEGVVRVFDRYLKLVGEIDDYSSLVINQKWHTFGDFELSAAALKQNTEALQKNCIVTVDGKRAMIITGRTQTQEKSGEFVTVKGYALSGLTDRRITLPAAGEYGDEFTNTPAGNIMRELVRRHCAAAGIRAIPFLTVEEDADEGPVMSFTSRLKNVADELQALSVTSGLGWTVEGRPGEGVLIFRVLTGRDRTYGNAAGNSPAVFSPQFDNLDRLEFTDSYNNYRNTAVVGGQGVGTDRTITELWNTEEEPEGLERFEVFIDARDINNQDGEGPLTTRGRMRLDETPGEFSVSGDTLANRNLILNRDYALGDLVTVLKADWGLRWDTRITGVLETWDASGYKASAQFGAEAPTLDAILKNRLKNQESEAVK